MTRNVPLGTSELASTRRTEDDSSCYNEEEYGKGNASSHTGGNEALQGSASLSSDDLQFNPPRPYRSDMADKQMRISTFQNWPHKVIHPGAKMAEMGFFYTGHYDLVRCFYCKIGLKCWNPTDDPWVEHRKFSPECHFINVDQAPMLEKNLKNSGTVPEDMKGVSVRQRQSIPESSELPEFQPDKRLQAPVQETARHPSISVQRVIQPEGDNRVCHPPKADICFADHSQWLSGNQLPVPEGCDAVPVPNSNEEHDSDSFESGDDISSDSDEEEWDTSGYRDEDEEDDTSNDSSEEEGGRDDPDNSQQDGNDIDLGNGRVCLHCKRCQREVQLDCGHKNICIQCFFCKNFWRRLLKDGPVRCIVCCQPTATVDFQNLQQIFLNHNMLNRRRLRSTTCGCTARYG